MQRLAFFSGLRSVCLLFFFSFAAVSFAIDSDEAAAPPLAPLCGPRITKLAESLGLAEASVRKIATEAAGQDVLVAAEEALAFLKAAPPKFFQYIQSTIHQPLYARTRPFAFRFIHYWRGWRSFHDTDPEPRLRLLQDAAKAADVEIPPAALPLLLAQINTYRWSDGQEHLTNEPVHEKIRGYATRTFEKNRKVVAKEYFDRNYPAQTLFGEQRRRARRQVEADYKLEHYERYLKYQLHLFYRSLGFFGAMRFDFHDTAQFQEAVDKHFRKLGQNDPALRKLLTEWFHHFATNVRGLGGEPDLQPENFRRNFLGLTFRSVYDWRDAIAAREELAQEEARAKAEPATPVWSFAGVGEQFAPVRRVRPRRVKLEAEEPELQAVAVEKPPRFVLAFTDKARAKLAELRERADRPHYVELLDKTLDFLATNPKHPGLRSHLIDGSLIMAGFPVRSSSMNNRTPEAYRVLWTYGEERGTILILRFSNHYEDL